MTYLLAIHEHGISAIIADMRETISVNGKRHGTNCALKSGILFPGVIYGISGHASAAREFIEETRRLANSGGRTLAEKWQCVIEQARRYDDQGRGFFILFASRASGASELYSYDSCRRELAPTENYSAIGSAARTINGFLPHLKDTLRHSLRLDSDSPACPRHLIPAYYCLRLTEAMVGSECDEVQRNGAGGLCYYIYQSADAESFQPTTIYLMCHVDHHLGTVAASAHRIVFVRQALVTELLGVVTFSEEMKSRLPELKSVIRLRDEATDTSWIKVAAHPYDFPEITSAQQSQEMAGALVSEAKAILPYRFCGLGFADHDDRGLNVGHEVENATDEVMFDPETPRVHPNWQKIIFERVKSRRRFFREDKEPEYPVKEGMLEFFKNVLGYNPSRIFNCVKRPDQCFAISNNSHQFRIQWNWDETAVLTFSGLDSEQSAKVGKSVIKTDLAFVIVPDLPAGRVCFEMPLSEVIDVFVKSFGVAFQMSPESDPVYVYSGPYETEPRFPAGIKGTIVGFGAMNYIAKSVDHLMLLNETVYLEWYREQVMPILPSSAMPTLDPGELNSFKLWPDG